MSDLFIFFFFLSDHIFWVYCLICKWKDCLNYHIFSFCCLRREDNLSIMNLWESNDLLNRAIARVHVTCRVGMGKGVGAGWACPNVLIALATSPAVNSLRMEKSEIGLTRVARSSPQWRRPRSPQAINTINRPISPWSSLDEWPQESPAALCPVWRCTAHNYSPRKDVCDSVTVHFILQSLCVGEALQSCHKRPCSHNWSHDVGLLKN